MSTRISYTNKDDRCVQDWLSEKDMLLTSHLEHELTVDDLPDETQVQLELSMRGGGAPLLSKPNHNLKFKSRLLIWIHAFRFLV